jgi:7-cyano-7-deazaguanine reductase
MTPDQSPLGYAAAYPDQYDPSVLFGIDRSRARAEIAVPAPLPFFGADIWNAYELSWLTPRGKPKIALATFVVPAESPHIVESKSFKLYLGSLAQTAFESAQPLSATLEHDISAVCGAPVRVKLIEPAEFGKLAFAELAGTSLDRLDLDTDVYHPDLGLLKINRQATPIDETLVSNLLKSNCPVTGQPDWGSIQIRYLGPPIDHASLLRYIISYRHYAGFHEQCAERIFMDILQACKPLKLAVYARYTRRGGLDINPFRTNFNLPLPDNGRGARQ